MTKVTNKQSDKVKSDSVKKFLTNSTSYASISVLALGASIAVGTNNANAADVATATAFSLAATSGAGHVIVTNAGTTITYNATAQIISEVLTVTDTVEGNVIITSAGDTSPTAAANTVDITSIVLDAAGAISAHSNLTIVDIDDRAGAMIVTIDGAGTVANGDLTLEGQLIIQSLEDTDSEALTVAATGDINIREAVVIKASHTGAVIFNAGTANVASALVFTGGVTLTELGTGLATLNNLNVGIVTGDIASSADDTGTLIAGAAQTYLGNVGVTGGFNLDEVQTDAATTFNGIVNAKLIDIDAATTITGASTFTTATVAANSTLTGAVTAATSITAAADVVLTFASNDINVGTAGLILTHDSSPVVAATFSGADVTITGDINADDTDDAGILNFTGAKTTVVGNLGAATGTNLLKGIVTAAKRLVIREGANFINQIDFGNAAELEIGKEVTSGIVFNSTTDMVAANLKDTGVTKIYMPVNLAEGEALTLFDGASDTTLVTNLNEGLQDTVLTDYIATKPTTGDYVVTANEKSAKSVSDTLVVSINEARALAAARISAIDDTNVEDTLEDTFYNVLTSQDSLTAADATALAKQVAPQSDVNSGAQVSTRVMTGTVQGIVSNRMASLRSGDAYIAGISAGSGLTANSGFIQAFGSQSEQDNIKAGAITTFGFDSETKGVALGFDGITDGGSTVGMSVSMSETDIDGKGAGLAKTSIDSHTISVYADKATDSGYIEGSLTYGINDNSGSRTLNAAGINRKYKSNYDTRQMSAKISAGAPTEVGNSAFLTPYGSVTGTIIETDVYTETSNTTSDNLRLKVDQNDINSLIGTLGLKAHLVTSLGTPMISFAINNEFGDTNIDANNTYVGGGTAFKTTTETEEMSATLGVGYSFGNDLSSINISYEGESNDSDYLSHYGSVKLVSKF